MLRDHADNESPAHVELQQLTNIYLSTGLCKRCAARITRHPFIFLLPPLSFLRFVRSSANNARPPSLVLPLLSIHNPLSQPSYFTFVLARTAIVHRVENRTSTGCPPPREGSFLERFTPNEGRENTARRSWTRSKSRQRTSLLFFPLSHVADELCNNFRFPFPWFKKERVARRSLDSNNFTIFRAILSSILSNNESF